LVLEWYFEGQRAAILSKQGWSLWFIIKNAIPCGSQLVVPSGKKNRPILPVRDYRRSAVCSFYSVVFQYFEGSLNFVVIISVAAKIFGKYRNVII